MLKHISDEEFKSEIFDYTAGKEWFFDKNKPVILNFFATWCGPCMSFTPTLEDIGEKYQDSINVFKVDIDQAPQLPALFGIRSVPTTLFLKSGDDPSIAQGVISFEGMEQAISDLLLNSTAEQ